MTCLSDTGDRRCRSGSKVVLDEISVRDYRWTVGGRLGGGVCHALALWHCVLVIVGLSPGSCRCLSARSSSIVRQSLHRCEMVGWAQGMGVCLRCRHPFDGRKSANKTHSMVLGIAWRCPGTATALDLCCSMTTLPPPPSPPARVASRCLRSHCDGGTICERETCMSALTEILRRL